MRTISDYYTEYRGSHNYQILFKLFILLYLACINYIRDLFKKNYLCHIFGDRADPESSLVYFFKKEVDINLNEGFKKVKTSYDLLFFKKSKLQGTHTFETLAGL